jgi:hypothetical protein
MKCFGDVVNVSKMDKVEKVKKKWGPSLCSKFDPTLHNSSFGIRLPTKMTYISYTYALNDHPQTF